MAVIIVYIFCFYIFFKVKKGSIARFLSLFFIASLSGYFLFFKFPELQGEDILHAIWICISIGAVVLPWNNFKGITEISGGNKQRIEFLGTFLIVLCIILDLSCGILSYYVLTNITDINKFKYVDGNTDFYYSLGIDLHGYILTTLLYPIGYLLVPYVFYYLSKGRKEKAILSFIGSMLPVFLGLTYFSRSHAIHFILIYLFAYFFLRNILPQEQRKVIKRTMTISGIVIIGIFVSISMTRFEDHDYDTGNRKMKIDTKSTTLISALDYFSAWWPNSETMFRRFDGETMGNRIIIQPTNNFFSTITFQLIPNISAETDKKREKLFREYAGSFIGVGAYTLYDQGPILGILLYFLYFLMVRKLRPRNGVLSLRSLLYIFALVQVPLYAIFYSVFSGVLLTLIFIIPMDMYLSVKKWK